MISFGQVEISLKIGRDSKHFVNLEESIGRKIAGDEGQGLIDNA